MLDFAQNIIGTQPILTAFLAIGLGYLVGQINIGGFSLGVGAVLFVGLALGAFAPKAQITGPIGLIGLIMFLYGVGILYGRQFFEGMIGAAGRKYNLLAFVAVIAGLVRRARAWTRIRHQGRPHIRPLRRLDDQHGHAAGGARHHAQQRAVDRLFGRLSVRRDRADSVHLFHDAGGAAEIPAERTAIAHGGNHARRRLRQAGRSTISDRRSRAACRSRWCAKATRIFCRRPIFPLDAGDALLVIAERQSDINDAAARVGKLEPGRVVKDRSALDYIRVFVGKANLVGVPLGRLPLPAGFPVQILHVRRYDVDIVPKPDLALEFGDRVGVLMPPDRKDDIRKYFGDTVKSAAEFSYVSLGVGMVLGVLLGLIPIPIPGVGTVTLGIGGGPLIVALIVGKLRRTGPLLWVMPLPANIVLRNFGLALFLAAVGVNAGQPFLEDRNRKPDRPCS